MYEMGLHLLLKPNRLWLVASRSFAKQVSVPTKSNKNSITDDAVNGELIQRSDKSEIDSIPKKESDNFLIEFNKRKPTYDQLFEYTAEEKQYDKSKPRIKSFISPDFKIKLNRKYDISWKAFKRVFQRFLYTQEKISQQYLTKRHGILGPDLATSHFIVFRGGRVRFKHKPSVWIVDVNILPNVYDRKYKLISVDASNINLIYEGLDNFILLNQLEELNLSGNSKLDDFACDKLARLFRNSTTLKYLDLSNIPAITHRGVEALYKIRSLQVLIINGTKAAKYPFIELLILMLNEVNPQCHVIYRDGDSINVSKN